MTRLICFLSGTVVAMAVITAKAQVEPLPLLPAPYKLTKSEPGFIDLRAPLYISFIRSGGPLLNNVVARFSSHWTRHTGRVCVISAENSGSVVLEIDCDAQPRDKENTESVETYDLVATAKRIHLHAKTWLGIDRGLSTLLQLALVDGTAVHLPKVSIHDQPRLSARTLIISGLSQDQPRESIQRVIDGMEATKLNFLRLAFVKVDPTQIAFKTSVGAASSSKLSTELSDLAAYGQARGVRVSSISGEELAETNATTSGIHETNTLNIEAECFRNETTLASTINRILGETSSGSAVSVSMQGIAPEALEQRVWPRAALAAEVFWSVQIPKDALAYSNSRVDGLTEQFHELGLLQNQPTHFENYAIMNPSTEYDALVTLAHALEVVPRNLAPPEAEKSGTSGEIADWASYDSRVSERFNKAVFDWIATGNTDQAPERELIESQLMIWSAAARSVKNIPADNLPGPQARVRLAQSIQSLTEVGLQAMRGLNHSLIDRDAAERAFEQINRANADERAGVAIPFLPALRLLVAAASEVQKDHPGSEQQWRRYLDTVVARHSGTAQ